MDSDTRLKRLKFRAWHRGTREADMLIGGFFDAYGAGWSEAERDWFELLLEEQDVDIVSWALGTATPPAHLSGAQMDTLLALGYVAPAK
jgi:antitoxin CptB